MLRALRARNIRWICGASVSKFTHNLKSVASLRPHQLEFCATAIWFDSIRVGRTYMSTLVRTGYIGTRVSLHVPECTHFNHHFNSIAEIGGRFGHSFSNFHDFFEFLKFCQVTKSRNNSVKNDFQVPI